MTASVRRIPDFLAASGWAEAERRPLAGDASARRYERLVRPTGSAILMDSPFPQDDVIPFVAIDRLLRRLGLSAPEIYDGRPDDGLLLLEDFGDGTFSCLLDQGNDPSALYRLGVDALVALHRRFEPAHAEGLHLPRYEAELFVDQVMLFADVYVPAAIGRTLEPAERAEIEAAWHAAVTEASSIAWSLLHRDYHVDNLMRIDGRSGVAACGILDFQWAGLGPVCYDLVSLLEDARRDVPADLAADMIEHYLAAFPDLDRERFRRAYAILGAVRHTRIIGVFARLWLRDGRPNYLVHLPRVWRLLEAQLAKPELAPVARWFDRFLPPVTRAPLFASKTER